MDFQTSIVELIADSDGLLERAASARRVATAAGAHTIYIRVAFSEQDRRSVPDRNKSFSAVARSDRMSIGTPGAEIHPALRPGAEDVVVTKTRVGAFSTTNLATHLAGRDIDTLILAGISTSGVVLSTIRDAADRDYRLFVLADCCADPDAEVHRILTERVFVRQAEVIESTDLDELFA